MLPGSNTCGVIFYSVKAKGFEDGRLYVTIPFVRGRQTVYLSPSLALTDVSVDTITSFLSTEQSSTI